MTDWDEAIEEAKENLGCSSGYIEDWSAVVEEAKDILQYEHQDEYDKFCDEAKDEHKEYLKSNWWKELRDRRIKYDKFICKDCGTEATQVHHNKYINMKTPWEFYELVSLCKNCHEKRHNIK